MMEVVVATGAVRCATASSFYRPDAVMSLNNQCQSIEWRSTILKDKNNNENPRELVRLEPVSLMIKKTDEKISRC